MGLDHTDQSRLCHFNSLFYLRPYKQQMERYDKQILLPLSEYLPFSFLKKWAGQRGFHEFFTPGRPLQEGILGTKWAPSICYEDTFSAFMHGAAQANTELFINVSNDNYYPRSALYRQHLLHARLRAVENGLPLVRACNGGGTAVIDKRGVIEAALPEGQEGVLLHTLSLSRYKTLFSIWGEKGIVSVCLGIVGLYLLGQALKFLELKRGENR